MVMRFFILSVLLALFFGCQENNLKMYTGVNAIQLADDADTLKRYSFYFQDADVMQDTVRFRLRTTGYTADRAREITVRQFTLEGEENAVEGEHYDWVKDSLNVPANAVYVDIPIVLYRNNLEERTSYFAAFELLSNENFEQGDPNRLKFYVEFSSNLLRPALWDDYYVRFYLGEWGFNKHLWLIEQTGHKWDDEFLSAWDTEPGLSKFWVSKLNELLARYNQEGHVLKDDNGNVINGFPN